MSSSTRQKVLNKQANTKDMEDKQQKLGNPSEASAQPTSCTIMSENKLLEEIKQMRDENKEGHSLTKSSLDRLEQAVADIRSQIGEQEERLTGLEERVASLEERETRHERKLNHLLRRETELTNTCEDLQNRLRRNNMRIFQVPEESEGGNLIDFTKELLNKVLTLPSDLDIRIERAHRALQVRPRDHLATPRSIVVRFLDAAVKDLILKQAWSQRQVLFQGKRIFFDQDYSPELQKKRARVRAVIKQLRQKGIGAKCLYPARLKLKLDSGEKIYTTLTSAAEMLSSLGVQIYEGEEEHTEKEPTTDWTTRSKKKKRGR
uniref:L1 transposable element RRM domain-containing protein n=3 Tax=Nothobranchius TaxID=28779 RepID=A0A1A8IZU7_NOTKU